MIHIYIYTRPRTVRREDVSGDRGMDRKWMDFLQQFVRWMTVWVVKWDFVTVEFEEIGEGLDGFKFGKFGSLLLVEELIDGSEIGWFGIWMDCYLSILKIDDLIIF